MRQYRWFNTAVWGVVLLLGAAYSLSASAGAPLAPPPVSQGASGESCLPGGSYLGIDSGDLQIVQTSPFTARQTFTTSQTLDTLQSNGLCSEVSAGSAVVADDVTRIQLTEYFNRLSRSLQSRARAALVRNGSGVASARQPRQLGHSAGDGLADSSAWSPWVSYSNTDADNDPFAVRYDSDQDNFLFGVDYSLSDRLIIGISGAYENGDIDTKFNQGEMEIDGITVAPYLAYLVSDTTSVDVALGYSDLEIDQYRTEPGGARVTGDTDSSRWFISGNVNTFHRLGDWLVTGRGGLIYSEEDQDAFTESGGLTAQRFDQRDIDFGQLTAGGEVAYSAHAIEPFASLFYEYDFEDSDRTLNNRKNRSDDDDDFRFSTGLRYFATNGITATLEYSTILDREDFDSDTVSLVGRYQF